MFAVVPSVGGDGVVGLLYMGNMCYLRGIVCLTLTFCSSILESEFQLLLKIKQVRVALL